MTAKGISKDAMSVIPFGADTTQFSFHPHISDARTEFIYIGNLNKVKDPYTAIWTFSILTQSLDCHLTVVGSDTLNGDVQEYARSLNVYEKITWKGKVNHETIPSLLHSSDFLLLTSMFEGEAVVVMEAFACGATVVGTKAGLLADVMHEEVTVEPGDAEGLAEKIERLFAHPERVKELRLKNRKLAEHYPMEWTCSEYSSLYARIAKRGT